MKTSERKVALIYAEGDKPRFDCLQELNDLIEKDYHDGGEMNFKIGDLFVSLTGIQKTDGEYLPKVCIAPLGRIKWTHDNYSKLKQDAKDFIEKIGYGRIIDEDNGNGFVPDISYVADRYLHVCCVLRRNGNKLVNHSLENNIHVLQTVRRKLKEDITYYDGII